MEISYWTDNPSLEPFLLVGRAFIQLLKGELTTTARDSKAVGMSAILSKESGSDNITEK
jgi:hypothetical protein